MNPLVAAAVLAAATAQAPAIPPPTIKPPTLTIPDPPLAPAGLQLVDGIAAVVDRRVLTLHEVELEARMILVRRAGEGGARQPLDDDLKQGVLSFLVVQELLAAEARKTPGLLVREAEVDKGTVALRARFLDEDGYRRFLAAEGVDEEDVRSAVRRDLAVEALLHQILAQVDVVDDKDADAHLAAHKETLPGGTDAERREAARDVVRRQRREAKFAAYVDGLKKTAEIRVLAPYATTAR